jgi:hypothetical protein
MKIYNMKNSIMKRGLLVLPIWLAIVSCSDFLEPESISTFDTQYIYSNVDDARKGVNAIYVQFGQDGFRSRLSNNMTGNTDIEHATGWDRQDGGRREIWNLNALPNNNDLRIFWNAAYTAIRDANIAIEGLEASEALNSSDVSVSKTMHHLLGEAYTLRAYWYSMLTFHFGDVPNVREAPKSGNDFFIPKIARNEILSDVIQDMIDVEERMMWADELPYGIEQASREYALGMIARLSLQRGGYFLTPELTMERAGDYLDYYQLANDYTKKLMSLKDRALNDDYREVFLNNSKFQTPVNDDILFEVPFAVGNGDVAWNTGITVIGGANATHDYGSGSNYMAIPATYYFSFDKEDARRDVTCALYYVDETFTERFVGAEEGRGARNIAQGKWSRHFLDNAPGKNSAKGTGINWPMLRYSDVLLMFAESENELNGPTASAKEALIRVRQRAFNEAQWNDKVATYVNNVSASKESFFDAIVDERAWEFGGEMIRKYELIRWNLYYDKVSETVEGLKNLADFAFDNTGPLAGSDLPDYLYWKRDESGSFVMLNPDYKVLVAPDDSWTRDAFLLDLHDDLLDYDEWVLRDWESYTDPPWGSQGTVRYVFPIPSEAITNSQGTIANDGYQFGL